jgi:hypothetical protein
VSKNPDGVVTSEHRETVLQRQGLRVEADVRTSVGMFLLVDQHAEGEAFLSLRHAIQQHASVKRADKVAVPEPHGIHLPN